MKNVSEKYQRTLDNLAEKLTVGRHLAEICTQDTVEFEPFPHGLRLCDPVEDGWQGIHGVGIPPRPNGPRAV